MINYIFFITLILNNINLFSGTSKSIPVKYISGFEIDLDLNGKSDIALLVDNSNGCELIVLMRINEGYKSYLLFANCENMNLSCNYGSTLTETTAGKYKGRKFTTNGTYLLLSQPESSKIAFFWEKNKFQEVWLAD